ADGRSAARSRGRAMHFPRRPNASRGHPARGARAQGARRRVVVFGGVPGSPGERRACHAAPAIAVDGDALGRGRNDTALAKNAARRSVDSRLAGGHGGTQELARARLAGGGGNQCGGVAGARDVRCGHIRSRGNDVSSSAAAAAQGDTMLYPELFKAFEDVRWTFERDVPWDAFRPEQLRDDQARSIKMNAITEWAALPATEMFLRDNRDDSDFSAFMSIWFYEEQKHALVLMEYLHRFRPDLVPSEAELHAVRFEFDPAP